MIFNLTETQKILHIASQICNCLGMNNSLSTSLKVTSTKYEPKLPIRLETKGVFRPYVQIFIARLETI